MVTFGIMQAHLAKRKTKLQGERNESLMNMPYGQYIFIVTNILKKVPFEFFVDALLNEEGLQKLKDKFDEAFEKEGALDAFSENINKLYDESRLRPQNKQ
jgi:hypothetical protein